jgi:hypothetical protein
LSTATSLKPGINKARAVDITLLLKLEEEWRGGEKAERNQKFVYQYPPIQIHEEE